MIGTGCSGTDLVVLVMKQLVRLWQEVFGLQFTVSHVFSVEHGELQQDLIKAHGGPDVLFQDMGGGRGERLGI